MIFIKHVIVMQHIFLSLHKMLLWENIPIYECYGKVYERYIYQNE
jgi:hypothetical protein